MSFERFILKFENVIIIGININPSATGDGTPEKKLIVQLFAFYFFSTSRLNLASLKQHATIKIKQAIQP